MRSAPAVAGFAAHALEIRRLEGAPEAARPRTDYPPLELTYLTERMYRKGIEQHETTNGVIRVYGVAKTVVDCFRFRNKVGLEERSRVFWHGNSGRIDFAFLSYKGPDVRANGLSG